MLPTQVEWGVVGTWTKAYRNFGPRPKEFPDSRPRPTRPERCYIPWSRGRSVRSGTREFRIGCGPLYERPMGDHFRSERFRQRDGFINYPRPRRYSLVRSTWSRHSQVAGLWRLGELDHETRSE